MVVGAALSVFKVPSHVLHLRQLAEDREGVQRGALRVGLRRATEADEGGERDLRDEARVDVRGVADGG